VLLYANGDTHEGWMMLRGLFSWLLLTMLVFAAGIGATSAEPRTALVIGNSRYAFSPLPNPENDASDMAAALRKAGFNVMLVIDADRKAMTEAVRTFGDALKMTKGMGLFFFAGHGLQIGGENYLVPVGDNFGGEDDIKSRSLKAADVVDAMAASGSYLNVVILDACRDNALGKTPTRGLSRIDSNARLFVSYSTSPGFVAQDGAGRNSPYTKYLTEAITLPDLSLEQTFKHTLKGVYKETQGEQTPWISSSFFGDFIFQATRPRATPDTEKDPTRTGATPAGLQRQAMQPPQPEQIGEPASLTGIYRADGRNPDGSPYKGMVSITQNGDRFAFKWWVGRQTFEGTGQLAGRMVVINWGDKTPVVYTFGTRGSLDGEWADGSATERLTLHARASEAPVMLKEGTYSAVGYHNGGKYQGPVIITRKGDRYLVEWKIGKDSYKGEGTLDGNLLTVNWGSLTPIVYAVAADGSLKGLWNAGNAEETLTPQQ
jgi:hypothetical protein